MPQRKCCVGRLKGVTVTVAHGELCHVIIPQDGMVLVSDIEELHCSHRGEHKDVLTCEISFQIRWQQYHYHES